MTYAIQWLGPPRPEYEPALRAEIDQWVGRDPSELLTHTMMVDGASYGSDGPSVHAFWDDGESCIFAEFIPVSTWISMNDVEEKS